MPAPRFTLKLSKLDWISLVDEPAQQTAKIRLIKRKGAVSEHAITMQARVAKIGGGATPLVHCWAFTCTDESGRPYVDLQGDAISADDFVKAAEEFMAAGGGVDELHDGKATKGRIAFAYPMDSTIAAAMLGKAAGDATKTSGLMVAIRPSAEQLVKIKSGEYTGVSIAGTGIRELMKSAPACPGCGAYGKADDATCAKCGKAMKRKPVTKAMPRRVVKRAVLTDSVDGHQHSIDLDDPADEWRDALTTSYQTSDGADQAHSHAWTFDATTGKITVADDSGHSHSCDDVVPDDVRAQAALQEDGERCPGCRALCDEDCKFCPACGTEMHRSGDCAPSAVTDEDSGPTVVVVAARAAKSPPSRAANTVKGATKEPSAMPDLNDKIKELEASNARLEKMSTLTDAQRAHFAKLSGGDAQQFLNLSPPARDVALHDIAKADEIVYTSPVSGKTYRKSASLEMIELVQQADAATIEMRKQTARAEEAEFAKRGETILGNFAKGVKGDLRGRLLAAVNKAFTDAAEHEEVIKALKAADFALKDQTVAKGVNPHRDPSDEPQTVQAQLDAMTSEYATKNNVPLRKAAAAILDTAAGAALYAKLPVGRA